jgi:hypothetical protein
LLDLVGRRHPQPGALALVSLTSALRQAHTDEDAYSNHSDDDCQKAEQSTDLTQTHISTIELLIYG